MTKIQQAILQAVKGEGLHLTAEEIHKVVKQKYPKVSLGTIYRNLSRFADDKLIRRVDRADAPDYFEGNTQPHGHSFCSSCGKVCDLHFPELKSILADKFNCHIQSVDLKVQCVCEKCLHKDSD